MISRSIEKSGEMNANRCSRRGFRAPVCVSVCLIKYCHIIIYIYIYNVSTTRGRAVTLLFFFSSVSYPPSMMTRYIWTAHPLFEPRYRTDTTRLVHTHTCQLPLTRTVNSNYTLISLRKYLAVFLFTRNSLSQDFLLER